MRIAFDKGMGHLKIKFKKFQIDANSREHKRLIYSDPFFLN